VFCSDMLYAVARQEIDRIWFIFMLAGPLALLTWIRSFRYLSFTSVIGDIALVLAMITMFIEGFQQKSIDNPFTDYPPIEYLSYPYFFGVAAFLFCVHMLMVPIEQSMQHPEDFNKALYGSFLVVTVFNLVFATIGYMLYKDQTKDIIINNLPDNAFVDVARIALVFDLFFTYVVVIVPARDIVEGSLLPLFSWCFPSVGRNSSWSQTILRCAIRTTMVALSVGIALSVKQISNLVGLVSGLSLSFMAFILPPMLHLRIYWKVNLDMVMLLVDVVLIIFGVIAAVATTAVSGISLVESFS